MRWDLHIHSQYSHDSASPLLKIVKMAKKNDLGGLAVTDHNTLQGYEHAKGVAKKFGLEIIPGYELMTKQGELLIFGVDELINPHLDVHEALEIAHELGAVVVAPHPFDKFRFGVGEVLDKLDVDGIEVINGKSMNNREAQVYAEKTGLSGVAGSDAHHFLEVGDAWTDCNEDPLLSIRKGACSAGGKGFNFKTMPLSLANKVASVLGWRVLR